MKKKNLNMARLLVTFLLLLVMITPAVPVGAVSGTVDLVLSPATRTVTVGDTFEVIVEAQCGSQSTDGIDVFLDYDPAFLAVQSVTAGTSLSTVLAAPTYNNSLGTFGFGAGQLVSPYPSGNFTVVSLTFEALAATDTATAVTFHTAGGRETMVDWGGNSITGTLSEGAYQIEAPTLTALEVTPGEAVVTRGSTQQFGVIPTYSNGSHTPVPAVTWSSSDTSKVTIDDNGLATAVAATTSVVTITASSGSVSGSADMTVNGVNLLLTPATQTVTVGDTFTVVVEAQCGALTTDGIDIYLDYDPDYLAIRSATAGTDLSTALPSPGIDNDNGTYGFCAGQLVAPYPGGTFTVVSLVFEALAETDTVTAVNFHTADSRETMADWFGKDITGTLTGGTYTLNNIPPPVLTGLEVSPSSAVIAKGLTQQFQVIPTYSDGSHTPVPEVTWSSSDTGKVTINSTGLATAVDITATAVTITATSGEVQNTAEMSVTEAVLTGFTISPSSANVAKGLTRQFTATPNYSDGSHTTVPAVTWSSSDTGKVTINSTGLATAVDITTSAVTITASSGAVQGTAEMSVTTAVLTGLTVAPTSASVAKGLTRQFTVTPTYSDGAYTPLPAVTWSSSDTGKVTIDSTGLAAALDVTATPVTITAAAGEIEGTAEMSVTAPVLTGLTVAPSSASVAKGLTRQFTVTPTYSDGTNTPLPAVTWSSSETGKVTIDNSGLATAVDVTISAVTITASSGVVQGTAEMSVTAAVLTGLTVEPASASIAKGLTQQFTVIPTYSDGADTPLPAVTWSSSDTGKVTIDSTGLAAAVDITTTAVTITAAAGEIQGTAVMSVTPGTLKTIIVSPAEASIAKGLTQQYTAAAIYSDNSTLDITSGVTWSSSDTGNVTIDSTGLATAMEITSSAVTITATSGTVQGTASLNVTKADLTSLVVTPGEVSVAKGLTQLFSITPTYSDGSHAPLPAVTWSSSDTAKVTIDSTGLATAVDITATAVTITATTGIVQGTAGMNVLAAVLQNIAVTPLKASIAKGHTQQYTATGTYSDASTQNITTSVSWNSSNTTAACINSGGLAAGLTVGSTNITANAGTITSDNAVLTISAAIPEQITITPDPVGTLYAGNRLQFTATTRYSDNSEVNLTASVKWISSNAAVASVKTGLMRTRAAGTTGISAELIRDDGTTITSNTVTVNVLAAVLEKIVISPDNATLHLVADNATSLQFSAIGVKSDGSTLILTDNVTWNSSLSEVATIAAGGLASILDDGVTSISATFDTITSISSLLTVLPDNLAPSVVVDYPVDGMTVYSAAMTLTGYVDDVNAVVSIILNGETLVETDAFSVNNETGEFSLAFNLKPGNNSIRAKAVDGAGNTGISGTRDVFYQDNATNPVVLNITSPRDRLTTNNRSLTLSGTAENTTSVTVRLNGVDQLAVGVDNGAFSKTVTLTEGNNVITVLSNSTTPPSSSGTITVKLDTTAPVVSLDSPAYDKVVNTPAIDVSGSVDDPEVSQVILRHFMGEDPDQATITEYLVTVSAGHFNYEIGLADGKNWLDVTAADQYGNTASTARIPVTLDRFFPLVNLTNPAGTRTFTNSTSLQLAGTIDDLSITTAILTLNGNDQNITVEADGSFSKEVTLVSSQNTITVSATDAGGNSGTSGLYSVTVDTSAPDLTIGVSEPTDSIIITVTANETLAAGWPLVTVDDGSSAIPVAMTRNGANNWIGFFSMEGSLPCGDYLVTITGVDSAGNSNTRTAAFSKEQVDIIYGAPVTVGNQAVSLDITSHGDNFTAMDVSVSQHIANPSGLVDHPGGAASAAVFVDINASAEFRDALKSDNLSLLITVSYNPAELPEGMDESNLKLYSWNTSTGLWEEVPDCEVDMENHTITGILTHLSSYGLFGDFTTFYTLTVNNSGNGSVNPAAGQYSYAAGTVVTLTAAADTGYTFSGWSGDLSGTTTPVALTMDADKSVTAAFAKKSSGGGGGGGGGGGSSTPRITLSGFAVNTALTINSSGILQSAVQLQTADSRLKLSISQGTKMLTAANAVLTSLSVTPLSSPPQVADGNAIILAYTLNPNGARFDPALTLTLAYDPAGLPAGVAESDLYLAYFDGVQWQKLQATADTAAKTLSIKINSLSNYALIGKVTQKPAVTTTITTPMKPSPTVSATPTPATTTQPAATTAVTTQAAIPTAAASITPATNVVVSTTPAENQPSGTPWGLITGIIAGVVVVVLIMVVIIRRRRV